MKTGLLTLIRKSYLASLLAVCSAIVATSLLAQPNYDNPFDDAAAKKSEADAKDRKATTKDAPGKKAAEAAAPATNLDDPFGDLAPPELRTPAKEKARAPADTTRRAPADTTRPGPADTNFPPPAETTRPAPSATTRPAPADDMPSFEPSPRLAPPESADPLAEPTDRSALRGGATDNPFEEMAPAPELDRSVIPDREPDAVRPDDSTADQLPAPSESFNAIEKLLTEGKFAEAIPLLESEAKQTPNDFGPHFYLGVAYRMVNRFDDALKSLTTAANIAGDVPLAGEIHLRRGIVWLHKGEYRIAYSDFETAAGMIANDPRAELWKGIALVKQDKAREAITAYSAAIRFEPRYELALMNRGLAYLAIDEDDMAVTDFDEVIRLNPTNALAYHRRGVALGRRGDYNQAVASYDAAIRLDPKLTEASTNRGMILQRAGQSGRAGIAPARARALESQIQRRAGSARVAGRTS